MTANVSITKKYTTPKGTEVTITGELILTEKVWLDGYELTRDCCKMHINVYVPGRGDQGGQVREMTASEKKQAPAGYNWKVGQLGLTDAQTDMIRSIKAELEQHPAWQANFARIAAADKADAEYEEHVRRVDQMMGKGWTY